MNKEKKWHNVSVDRGTMMICETIAKATGVSTASLIRDMITAGLNARYGETLRDVQRKQLKQYLKEAS
jgi:hypothetical protein